MINRKPSRGTEMSRSSCFLADEDAPTESKLDGPQENTRLSLHFLIQMFWLLVAKKKIMRVQGPNGLKHFNWHKNGSVQ